MKEQIQAIVTVLSLVNPAICAMMFTQAVVGRSRAERLIDATKAIFAVFLLLTVAALVGTRLLDLFGVSLDAFMVAGGGVLAWMGFSMLSGSGLSASRNPTASANPPANSDSEPSLTPLVLFAASPGTITGVITIAAAHTKLSLPVTAFVAIAVATLSTWLVMLVFSGLAGKSKGGGGFLRDTITRLMGLIVLSMGVQFALTGIRAFAH